MRKKKILSDTMLPDNLFVKDDIIKIKNKNKGVRYVRISKVIYFGDTIHCEECGQTFTTMKGYRYEGIYQEDSISENDYPIRPGKAELFTSDFLEAYQKVINYTFTLVDGDNPLNIQQREKEWRSQVLHKGK